MDVIEQAKGRHKEWVFPGPSDLGPLSNMSLLRLLRREKQDSATTHGFRSSFRDWAAEKTSFPREVAEMALAHVIESDTEAAYRRGDLFDKRRELMQAWGTFLTETAQNQGPDFFPLATTLSALSGIGRCSLTASAVGAVSQVSTSAGVVRITGMAFG